VGTRILIDDGLIELEVKSATKSEVICRVINGGELGERKGVNVPGVSVRLPSITEKDREDILFGIEQGVDFIAASFVRNADAIREIKKMIKEKNAPYIPIIAKIENEEGIQHIDEILEVADGVMVARGDLGVEIPVQEIPHLQKWLIQKCNDCDKPVITATQMLDSMIRNPRPTRAEVTDVANAVYDGTDAVMLSGETAQGKYPIESLRMMVEIIKQTEEHLDEEKLLYEARKKQRKGISNAIGYAAVMTANSLQAKCIITPTASGATARVVSKFRPKATIAAVSPNENTLRRMQILRGVYPIKSVPASTTEEICAEAIGLTKEKRLVASGDTVVVIAGIPSPNVENQNGGMSNMMRIAVVDEKTTL
jgi:pyruvate kinase